MFYIALIVLAFAGACKNPFWPQKHEPENNNNNGETTTIIKSANIFLTSPVSGSVSATVATTNDTGYTCGAVSWFPNDNLFVGNKAYTASVTLLADKNYTFSNVLTANINNQEANITNNTDNMVSLSLTFAATSTRTVTGITVKTQPSELDYTHGDPLNLTGLVVTLTHDDGTTEDAAFADFTAQNITTNPANGASLSHTDHNARPVEISYGGKTAYTNNLTVSKANPTVTWPAGLTATYGQTLFDISLATYTNSGGTPGAFNWTTPSNYVGELGAQSHNMIFTPNDTASYHTLTQSVSITVNKINIAAADITITGPVKGSAPVTTATTTDTNYTIGTVSWSPTDNSFLGGKVYTAAVTLTANSGYTFAKLSTATVNGQSAAIANNTGDAVTLSYTFPETDTRTVTGIAIKTQPTKLDYTHGDQLDLTGLAVTLTHDDASTEDVAAAGFIAKNITVNPAHGIHLAHITHNNQPVTITYGGLTPLTTPNLTVNKAVGTFDAHDAINKIYSPGLTLSSITLPAGYAWVTPSTSLNAGNNQSFTATYTDPSGNYETATGTITVNVEKADGIFAAHDAINATYAPTLTLASLNSKLMNGYAWNTPSTSLSAGNNQSFTATYTDKSGNYEVANGNITVNVAKAPGITVNTPTLNTRTHNSITINPVSASTGQTVEYASNAANATPSTGWQTDTTLSGLNAGTTYYIFARSAGNSNYETGTASGSLTVTTLQTISANRVEYYWVDEHDVITTTSSGAGNTIILPRGETLTITANGSGYSNQRWYINGTEDKLQAGNVTYFFSSEEKDARQYTVTLIVKKDGKYYNTNFAVTVTG